MLLGDLMTTSLHHLQDLYGFNLAGLQYLRGELDSRGTHVFGDVSKQLKQIRKKRKMIVHNT